MAFYYLRKKFKYYPEITKKRSTTTDMLFQSRIRGLWSQLGGKYDEGYIWEKDSTLQDYIDGHYLYCGSSWKDIDFVYIPMYMEQLKHWILGELDLEKRRLNIFNSLRSKKIDQECIEAVIPMAILLPHLLESRKFSEGRPDLNWGKSKTKMFEICM